MTQADMHAAALARPGLQRLGISAQHAGIVDHRNTTCGRSHGCQASTAAAASRHRSPAATACPPALQSQGFNEDAMGVTESAKDNGALAC